MRRFVTVTLLGLALAGCSAQQGQGELITSTSSSPVSSPISTARDSAERSVYLKELCEEFCDDLTAAAKEPACTSDTSCSLLLIRYGDKLGDLTDEIQAHPSYFDAPFIGRVGDAFKVSLEISRGDLCAGMTPDNTSSFGSCLNKTASFTMRTGLVGSDLRELARD